MCEFYTDIPSNAARKSNFPVELGQVDILGIFPCEYDAEVGKERCEHCECESWTKKYFSTDF